MRYLASKALITQGLYIFFLSLVEITCYIYLANATPVKSYIIVSLCIHPSCVVRLARMKHKGILKKQSFI